MRTLHKIIIYMLVSVLFCTIPVPVFAYEPELSASASILMVADTGTVLYAKNEKEHRSIASTTKIMTALLTLEAGSLDKTFTVDSEAIRVEGTSMGLREGDIVSRRALCYGMLLPSGNDSANAAAVSVSGTKERFAMLMNSRARAIGMENSVFVTPSGLDADGQYSCAYDLALLTCEALKNEDFCAICSSNVAKLSYGNPPYDRYLKNSNKLLNMIDGCIGVKTGFTDDAGRTLVSAVRRGGITLIAVTLNAPDDWNDHKKLYDYGFSAISMRDVNYDLSDIAVNVIGGDNKTIPVYEEKALKLPLTADEAKSVTAEIHLPKFVYPGYKAGDRIGRIEYILNGKTIGTNGLVTAKDCETAEDTPDIVTRLINLIRRFIGI